MNINYLGGLYREIHHIRQAGNEDTSYEPSLVILDHQKKGRSFVIPLSAIWKYIEPKNYKEDEKATKSDWYEFNKVALKARLMSEGRTESGLTLVSGESIREGNLNMSACAFAYMFHKGTGVYCCTAYNLAKCMQMFDITMCPQAAAQLLLWIQDRLDDLKNAPEPEKDKEYTEGEAEIFVDGDKVATKEMKVTDTDLVLQEN